ncbi:type II secretion system F family protein [Alicyclobacillus vulcanalis]|nr:type II secretion system F family protein [Alicyclobacillus vulcanalis]
MLAGEWIRLLHRERDMALWLMQFSRMLRAGVDVRLAASALGASSGRIGSVLSAAVERQVERGEPLSDAFSMDLRDADWRSLLAAEHAGTFAESLERVAAGMLERVRWRQTMFKQLGYPCMLLCGTYGLFGFMVVAVLPTLQRLSALLPGPAAHRRFDPALMSGACLALLSSALIFIAMGYIVKRRWPEAPIPVPFQMLLLKIRTERVADQLASQLEAGIGAWEAVAWMANKGRGFDRHLQDVHERLRQGFSLHEAFASAKHVLDPLFLTLLEVGEATGEVADRLREGQKLMQFDIVHRLETIAQFAEPVAVTAVGLVVGVMVYSIMVPMYQAIAQLS